MPATALRQGPDAAATRLLKRIRLLRLVQRMGAVCTLLCMYVCGDEVGSGMWNRDWWTGFRDEVCMHPFSEFCSETLEMRDMQVRIERRCLQAWQGYAAEVW